MKKILLWLMLIASFSSCDLTKRTSSEKIVNKGGGVIPDSPEDIRKANLFVSTPEVSFESARKPRPGTVDNVAPTVVIYDPANGAKVSGLTAIYVNASDYSGIASVWLTVNGVNIGTKTISPYKFSYDFVKDTIYRIVAYAKDTKGNVNAGYAITVSKTTIIIVNPPVELKPSHFLKTPPVVHQGGEGSCAAQSAAYVRSIYEYYKKGHASYSDNLNRFSPEYLYNKAKPPTSSCGAGSGILANLNIAYAGSALWYVMPYSSQNGCDISLITPEIAAEALTHKMSNGYASVLPTDRTQIKTLLSQNKALSFGTMMCSATNNPDSSFIWKTREGTTTFYVHQLTVVGYDDSKNAYRVQNSWGEQWCNKGFIWIDYNFFEGINTSIGTEGHGGLGATYLWFFKD